MKNGHCLLVGKTGSGKTALARALLRRSARALVLDSEHEYDNVPGALVYYSFDAAADALLRLRWREFCIVFRPEQVNDYMRILQLAEHIQYVEPHGPLVICMEEMSNYSDTYNIESVVRDLYNKGRHRRISMLSVIQVDTDIHRVTRSNSKLIVSMAQNQLTGPLSNKFNLYDVQQLRALEDETRHIAEPVQGVHFLTYPAGVQLYPLWTRLHGYILEPVTEQTDNTTQIAN